VIGLQIIRGFLKAGFEVDSREACFVFVSELGVAFKSNVSARLVKLVNLQFTSLRLLLDSFFMDHF
jgi:hypothetical protein